MRLAGGACGISGSGMSNTTGGGPASCAGTLAVGVARRGRGGARSATSAERRQVDRRGRPADRLSGGVLVLLATLLAAQRAVVLRLGAGRSQRRVLGLLLLALLLLRRLGRALLGSGRTARRHQIGRHRGAHLRTGGVVLAQKARDVAALREPLRALVASRTGRGEDPRRVPRIGELRLRPQGRPAYPDCQGRQDRPDRDNVPEARHLKPPHRRRPPPPASPSTCSAFVGRREPQLQRGPPPLPHCR